MSGPEAIQETLSYLRALDDRVRALYQQDLGLMDAVDRAQLPAFAGWALYGTAHRRNALHRYLQLEREELGG